MADPVGQPGAGAGAIKPFLRAWVEKALTRLRAEGALSAHSDAASIQIERARDPRHGDFASPLPMLLARAERRNPRALAQTIVDALPLADPSASARVARVEAAAPGFINFSLADAERRRVVAEALDAGAAWGRSSIGAGRSALLEFVSANPTGPLHVGHGRGAAYGATLANLLTAVGFRVHREYYVNDSGRQMDILAVSVWLRYLQRCGEPLPFPSNGYQGDYIGEIAATLQRRHGETLRPPTSALREAGLFADGDAPLRDDDAPSHDAAAPDAAETHVAAQAEPDAAQAAKRAQEADDQKAQNEARIDALIDAGRRLLGAEGWRRVVDRALETLLDDIRADLEAFGAHYDEWFSERALRDSGALERALERLRKRGHLYAKEGAQWFRATAFGDSKDRVLVRADGRATYFAVDIAYHLHKLERGFDRLIDIWGADHHGYIPRMRAALEASGDAEEGQNAARLEVLLVQFVSLRRGSEQVKMSTRGGAFVTLRRLREEVGNDAARFFYVMRRCEQQMDFDIGLARSRSVDNPVYYVQYAHARIHSVMRQLRERGWAWDEQQGRRHLQRLAAPREAQLMATLARFPESVEEAAMHREPHRLVQFLRDAANDLHAYYDAHRFLVDDAPLRDARLALINAARITLANGLALLGVSAPEEMR